MNNDSIIKIQRWYRYKKYDEDWWPINSYKGSMYSYNKWLELKENNTKHICFECVIL